jgi:hypothetical protein
MDALRKWREGLPQGYRTLEAAGAMLGVTGVQMHRYENDKRRIPPEKVISVSAVTQIPPEILRPDIFGPPRPLKHPRHRVNTPAG